MVVFDGYLTGAAERHYYKKSAIMGQKILFVAGIIMLPMIIGLVRRFDSWAILLSYCGVIVLAMLLTKLPKSKKEKADFTPKKIYAEEEYIVCIRGKSEEIKRISDAETVYDYGDYYDIVFPFGKVSDGFVCQKDLLTKGTLEEFEQMFEGKIIRKIDT